MLEMVKLVEQVTFATYGLGKLLQVDAILAWTGKTPRWQLGMIPVSILKANVFLQPIIRSTNISICTVATFASNETSFKVFTDHLNNRAKCTWNLQTELHDDLCVCLLKMFI